MVKRHAHHLLSGVAWAALAAYGLGVFLQERTHSDVDALARLVRQRRSELESPKEPPPPARAWTRDALSPWTTSLAGVAAVNPWAATIPTKVIETSRPRIGPKPPQAAAPALAFEKLELGQEGATLSWSVREWTSMDKAALSKENKIPVELTGFKVERRSAGGWTSIATLDAKARSYTDATTEPKTAYAYRVTALSATRDFLERGDPSGVAGVLLSPSVTSPDVWTIAFSNPSAGAVYVRLRKYEKALGAWAEIRLIQRDGERLGWKGGTSKHVAPFPKGAREVDFDSGLTLVSVKPKKESILIARCEPAFFPGGAKILPCPKVKEARSFDVHEVVTEGVEGRRTQLLPDPKEHPNAKDQLCPACAKPN